jgi:hypothetical protein
MDETHDIRMIGDFERNMIKQGVCHTMALPFTLKSIFKTKED